MSNANGDTYGSPPAIGVEPKVLERDGWPFACLEERNPWRHLSDGVITSGLRSCSASWHSTLPIAGNGKMACDEK